MVLTRSTPEERTQERVRFRERFEPARRRQEKVFLLAASIIIALGLLLNYSAVTHDFAEVRARLASRQVANLNTVEESSQLVPLLKIFPDPDDRRFAAQQITKYVSGVDPETGEPHNLSYVGTLLRIRIKAAEVESAGGLDDFRRRLEVVRGEGSDGDDRELTIPLLTPDQFRRLKPSLVVRTPEQYNRQLGTYAVLFFISFFAVHFLWQLRRFPGDGMLLPAVAALAGLGFMLMASLRDPLRDTTIFAEFIQGVALGCLAMAILSFPDYERTLLRRLSFVPLLASFLLSIVLILFGSGPGQSDAKVNLEIGQFSFQPVEAIKLLLVLFLAGYFASHWEFLRELKEEGSALVRALDVPKIRYALPVVTGVALSLVFFFLQRDLGPALIISFLFLTLYAVARSRAAGAVLGALAMAAGFAVSYWIEFPETVAGRISIWISPWNNYVRPGGDHLAHSFWAFSTGGLFGTGSGMGQPEIVPAVHTDLVLSAIGEELGFAGLLAIFGLFAVLVHRSFRISLNAKGNYSFWLGLGMTLLLTLHVVFIAGGVLGLIPFSGIATPFLSYGRSATLANFVIVGILAGISAAPAGEGSPRRHFFRPVRWLMWVLGIFVALALIRLAILQVIHPDGTVGAGVLTVQADGARRFAYNPRLLEVARTIPRGTVYDRNNIPLATSDWEEIERHRKSYEQLNIDVDHLSFAQGERYYPFGALTFHLLGDLRTRVNWAAGNTSFVERDSSAILQGYDDHARVVEVKDQRTGESHYLIKRDYRELIPLLRYRYRPSHPEVQEILNRNRDVHLTLDIRLQKRVAEILESHILGAKQKKGAAVLIDARDGSLLATVTYPWAGAARLDLPPVSPDETTSNRNEALMDRPRYAIYPPGSAFKLVTAMAALRKNPDLYRQIYDCIRLPDGRVGNYVRGWGRPIRDDVLHTAPDGRVDMAKGLIVSCNAYFAQLAAYAIGSDELNQVAGFFRIKAASPDTPEELKRFLPVSGYGQGEVVATPLQMARVAAAVGNDGRVPSIWWVKEEASRTEPESVVAPAQARRIAQYMRGVVTAGTGRALSGISIPVAGKTGTAELTNQPSHAWFIGFAPYASQAKRQIAFAVIIENGVYGGRVAAPPAGEMIEAAVQLGLFQ